ncbi:hypothetical protein ZWY2020_026592 [Hordeum vulgare]|nr:hypothetical protein ZWY2020_026592 [Hordeum vulgare]
MEHGKLTSLEKVLTAARATKSDMTVNIYINELACLEESMRNCYANTFDDMKSKQFVRMLLLDGCYILSRLVIGFQAHPEDDATVTVDVGEALSVLRDVFYLAENQIPLFVLEKIGELTTLDCKDRVTKEITKYALNLLRTQKYAGEALAMVPSLPTARGNLLHLHLKPACCQRLNGGDGTLEVPCLNIKSETCRLMRKLEQRNRKAVGSHVTAYCVFMSQVACTPKGVELLSKRDVIVHSHGNNDEVAKCFADLRKGIQFDPERPRVQLPTGDMQDSSLDPIRTFG